MNIRRELLRRGIPILGFGLIIFFAAGRLDYFQGWSLMVVVVLMNIVTVSSRGVDKELVQERAKPGEGSKEWDALIIALAFPVYLVALLVGALDSGRFHWSGDPSWTLSLAGVALNLLGLGLFETAKRQN